MLLLPDIMPVLASCADGFGVYRIVKFSRENASHLTQALTAQAQALPAREETTKRGDLQRTAVVAAPPAPTTQPTVASTESKKVNDGPIIMNGQVGSLWHDVELTTMVPYHQS